ncbi:MAG TPA: hypothetical protein VGR22_04420 [Thermomicrobiales bacterium]|nr:hypothetical protein [Thermomicrobiales bacterium]
MIEEIAVRPLLGQPHRERERWLRHQVREAGCRLHRSRRDEDRYMIFDLEQDGIAAGDAFELTLDDVAAWIGDREHLQPDL